MRSAAIVSWLVLLASCSGSLNGNSPSDLRVARKVDSPLKSHLPTRNAAGTRTEEYFGGPVIPNAKVYAVWWGDPANLSSAVTAAHGGIADFFTGVTNSNFIDWLNEYDTNINAQAGSHSGQPGTNQHIGRGNYVGAATLSGVQVTGTVTDAQIQSALDAAFTAGTLPEPDANTIYAIYFPSSVSIDLGGSTSCIAFGAYHENTTETARHDAYYLVMPDCGDSFSGVTVVTSHELAEAITDPDPTPGSNPDYPQAWNDASGNEVGDLCESSSGSVSTALGTFSVQGIWDERSQGCKVFTSAAQDFNLALSPNTATLAQGGSATFTVQTATVAGASESLTLSATAPAGVTATVSPSTVTSGSSATLTVTAASAGAASALQVTVQAAGAAGTHSASLLLAITGAAGNDFSLSATPSSATAAPGGTALFTVSTAVTSGSAQAVTLSVTGLPTGATGTFTPASVNAGSGSTLGISVGSATAPGTYSLTITGTGTSATHQASVSLVVSGATTNSTTVTAPADGSTVSGSTTVTATANFDLSKIELYVDGTLLATGTSSPFSSAWDTTKVADGAHQLTSKAYDGSGNAVTSAAVNVTVSNGSTTQCPPGTVDVGGVCVPTGTGCSSSGTGGVAGGLALLLLGAFARSRRRS